MDKTEETHIIEKKGRRKLFINLINNLNSSLYVVFCMYYSKR